ncbi:MAG: hypothetical protein A2X58_10160 [Nitrospirae bacterium GWC2_56_14]|nr:MAG: hypothetical protein A2X58_10160 [Nitrospirae bacterium GWC2_56_14]
MSKHVALSALLFLVLLGLGTRHAFADIYQYVNDEGVISFVDNLESVPEKYRATAVNTTAVEEQNRIQSQAEQPVQPGTMTLQLNAFPEESAFQMTFFTKLLMTAVVVFAWFGILVIIKKTDVLKGREKILPATRIALACIFLVYLVMVHGKDVAGLFTMAGNKIEAVKEKQAQRGKKAGQAIKALNQFMDEAGKQPPPPEQDEEKNN